jgi:type II secretory pathway pseudopilin PulG
MATSKQHGFSLVEMMITVAIAFTMVCIAFIASVPALKQQRVVDAYNTTLTALRHAHDAAAADMRIYTVTFSPAVTSGPNQNGGTITVTQDIPTAPVLFTATLPWDVTFQVLPGVPTSPTVPPTTPDGFGTAAHAFDFDQATGGGGNVIYFYPDGSAQDAGPNGGNINNGVVYMGRTGDLYSARAITLWGATGRIRGWRLYPNGSGTKWVEQ